MAATKKAAPEAGPKPAIYEVEGNLHGRIAGADAELVMPLQVPYRQFKKLLDLSQDDPLEDLERFIVEMDRGDASRVLDQATDVVEVLAYAMHYFGRFNELAEARLGEFRASSGS